MGINRIVIISWLFAIGILISCESKENNNIVPNIIYIMVDDLGYADLSIYGRTNFQTPNIDALVGDGIKFTQAYAAAPICTPTRVGLMTGRYPARNPCGLYEPLKLEYNSIGLSPEILTLPRLMKDAGYNTALFGKWHLGILPSYHPTTHGFDRFWGIVSGHADYTDHMTYNDQRVLYENNKTITTKGYLTDLITDQVIDFIQQKHKDPFFMSIQYTAPHWPWQAPGDAAYPNAESVSVFKEGGSNHVFAKMVQNLDGNIGRIVKELENQQLSESTLIIFTSDNGGEKFSDHGNLQGRKGNLFEGGIKVPACVVWPGKIKPNQVSKQAVITMDWTVTMLDLAKANVPSYIEFDGISLVPHLMHNQENLDRVFYWRTSNHRLQDALRSGNWKYLRDENGQEYLFDLLNDPGETINLKGKYPTNFDELKLQYQNLDKTMLDRLELTGI